MGTSYSISNDYRWFWHIYNSTENSESWTPFPLDQCLSFEKAYQSSAKEFKGEGFVLHFDRDSEEQTHVLVNVNVNVNVNENEKGSDNCTQTCVSRKIPGEVQHISRSQRMNSTCFARYNNLNLGMFYYIDLFEALQLDQTDPFIKEFTSHVTLLDHRLIKFLLNDYKPYLVSLVKHLSLNTFSFEAMCQILKHGFLHSSSKDKLEAYVCYYMEYFTRKNIVETIVGMFAEEGELYPILNRVLRTSTFKDGYGCVLFLLCLIFLYETCRKLACTGNQVVYAMMNYTENDYELVMNSIYSPCSIFTNLEFMSTCQSMLNAMKCPDLNPHLSKHVLLEITIDKIEYDQYSFLALKPFDISPNLQYQEIIFPPNGVFKVRESSYSPQDGKSVTLVKVDYQTNFITQEILDYSEHDKLLWGISSMLNPSSGHPLSKILSARLNLDGIDLCKEMRNLIAISMKGSSLGEDGVSKFSEIISDLPRLKYIDLGCNVIGDEGLKVFSEHVPLFQIQYLKLSNNQINAAGISIFAEKMTQFICLILLDLSENLIGDDGMCALAAKLPLLSNLEVLDVSKNQIMNQGIIALAEVFHTLPQLVSLSLKENQISKDGMIAISANLNYLTNIRTLNLGHINDISITPFKINPVNSIQFLFCHTQKINLSYLQTLDLSSNQIEKKMISSFALNLECGLIFVPMLQILNLNGNKILEDGMIALTSQFSLISNLRHFHVKDNDILDGGVKALAKNVFLFPNLQSLDISRNQIGDDGISELAHAFYQMPNLNELNMSHNLFTSTGMSVVATHLHSLVNLHVLNLSGNTRYSLGNIPKWSLSDKLQSLNLNYTSISSKSMEVFSSCLPYLPCLNSLHLHGNLIGASGIKALVRKFSLLPHLQLLDLTGNQITSVGIRAFAQHISSQYEPSTIRDLFLSSNQIDDDGLKGFCLCIPFLSSLRSIDLSSNLISDEGVVALSSHFHEMRSLEYLNLSSNCFGNECVIQLSEKIPQLGQLQSLELKYNNVGDEGINSLSASLSFMKIKI